jgi:integrase
MRRNEILNLTRHSIDWQNRLVTLEDTKNGETRHVPLNDTAVEVLRSLPARFDGRLFPFKDGHSVSRAFPALSNARESPISGYMTAAILSPAITRWRACREGSLQSLLGHKDPRMTLRYSHLSDAYLRTVVNAAG